MTRPRITLHGSPLSDTIIVLATVAGTVVWSGEYSPDVRLVDVLRDIPILFT